MKTGIYYNSSTKEITAVAAEDGHLGSQWQRVSGEVNLGLVAVRRLLVERGIVDNPTEVYWFLPQPAEEVKIELACNAPDTASAKPGLLSRLSGAFRGGRRPPQTVP